LVLVFTGGCKHGVAFLLWLHRRSEEPSVTSKECYWKKSALSQFGKAKSDLHSLLKKDLPSLPLRNSQYVRDVVCSLPTAKGGIFDIEKAQYSGNDLSIYQLFLNYRINSKNVNADDFIEYIKNVMTEESCVNAEKLTRNQSKDSLWYELKFGRVTASRFYEVCHCKTAEGSLMEKIMGASALLLTDPVIRGQNLEALVIKQVEAIRNIKIKKAGLFLRKDIPIFGASPDGITDTHCVEVKCPSKEKTRELYEKDGIIKKKFLAQLQLQMYITNRAKGLFCIASPNFEVNKEVSIFEVQLDKEMCCEMIEQATLFWKMFIFKSLCNM